MTPEAALIEMLDRVAAAPEAVAKVTDHELNEWPSQAIQALKSQRLIVKARPATSAICTGCTHDCEMEVHTVTDGSGDFSSFILCDKLSDTNRVPVAAEQLTQWRCCSDTVCNFIIDSLGMRRCTAQKIQTNLWEAGIFTGQKRSQMVCLQSDRTLSLVIDTQAIPLAEFVGFEDEHYSLNRTMVRQMVDNATSVDERYTPKIARREARKLETKARDEQLQKAYRKLKKDNLGKSDSWCSKQLAKMDIGKSLAPETIRRKIKG